MADTSIVIRVDISGSNKVTNELDKIVKKTKEVDKTAQLLRNAFAALGGAALAKQLLSIADTYTNIQNRLKLVTSSTAELAATQNQLLAIANNTRQSFEETVATYTKTVSATKQLGLSQRDTLKFTELLNKTVAQSGASTAQAAAGLQQLSQGLGSGSLRGDELNSILENLPNIADLISQELNVTRGELRQLGSDGKISAQVIIDSFLKAEKQINEGFGKVAPTIGQSFTVLQNQITVFFGSLAQSSGFSEAFARGLLFIANNIDTVVRLIGVLALTITQVLVQRALVGAVVAIRAFVTALTFSNFITATIQGIYLVTAAIVAFSDKLKLTSTGAATLADFFIVAFQKIAATVKSILVPAFDAIANIFSSNTIGAAINKVADTFDAVGGQATATEKVTTSAFQRIALGIARAIDSSLTAVTKGTEIIKLAFTSIVTPIENAFIQLSNSIAGILNSITTAAENAINVTKGFFGSTQKLQIPKIGQQALKPETSFFEERQKILDRPAATGAQDFVKGLFSGAEDRAQKRLEDEAKRKKAEADALNKLGIPGAKGIAPPSKESVKSAAQFAESIRDLQAELDLLKEGNQQLELRKQLTSIEDKLNRPLSPGERQQATSLIQQVEALREQSAALTDIQGPQEAYVQRTAALDALLQKGSISQSQYTLALQAAQLPFERSISDLDQQIELLHLSESAHNRQAEILRIEAERGEALSESQRSQLESRYAEVESLQAQNNILSELRGPQEDYAKQLEALEGLHQRVGLSAAEYNSVLSDIRLNYLETQNTASAGFQAGLLTIQKQFGDVAGLAQDTLVNAFGDAEDALVEFVETGKFNFKDLTDSILADITRLAIRQSITAPLAGLLGGAAAGGGGGGGGGLLGGLFGALGGLFSSGGGGGSFNNSGFSGGFALAEGGRFRVGGTGGVDSQFVPLHLTPGELIEVTPPGQSSGTTVNYFIQTNDADSFRASQAQIMRDTQISLNRNTRKLQ